MTQEGPLDDLVKYTSQWTNDAIDKLFDNVDNQLFDMAEQSEKISDQNIFFDAMRIIRRRRKDTHEAFMTNVKQGFTVESILSQKEIDNDITDLEDLSLMADDNLEENLAAHNLIAKAERDSQDTLRQLNQRLAFLYDGLLINSENNPIGPTSLCHSFISAVNTLEAKTKVKLLVYKLFDINFVSNLSELYQNANKMLIEKGVLPDLKISYKHTVKRQPRPNQAGLGDGTVHPPVQDDAADSQNIQENNAAADAGLSQFMHQPGLFRRQEDSQTFALIQQLLTRNKPVQQQYPQAQYASTNDVVNSLSQLQINPELNYSYTGQQDGQATSGLLKEALKQTLQENQQKEAINQNDDNMIDVIGLLFDFILDDDNLVDSVKSLLSRLQIPIIKISLQDKNFFKSKSHPARKFLNDLANAGLGITDNVTAHNNPLYLKLESLVNRVINEQTQDSDASFFEDLNDDLHRFLSQFNQGLKNKRRQQKNEPSEDAAMQLVSTELSSRIDDKILPDNIILLLERVWKDVMFDIFYDEGMESDDWDMAMTFVDTLLWSVDPKTDPQSQKKLVKVIPGILNALNSGLDRINYPGEAREQLLQDLQDCHLATMKGKDIRNSDLSQNGTAYQSTRTVHQDIPQDIPQESPVSAASPILNDIPDTLSSAELDRIDAGIDTMLDDDLTNFSTPEEEELLAAFDDESEQAISDHDDATIIDDAYTQQARDLSAGAWVEFAGEEDQTYRAKISWMSEDASAYIFVTQTGQIAEKTLQGLSAALRNKQATILDESPVFERALGAVLEELQENT